MSQHLNVPHAASQLLHLSQLAVDSAAVRALAEQLVWCASGMEGDFCIAAIAGASGEIQNHAVPNRGDAVAGIVAEAERLAERGQNIYFSGALFKHGSIKGNRGRTERNVVAVLGLVCDFDAKHDPASRHGRLPREPDAEVETSEGNFQCHYYLDRPCPVAEAKSLQKALTSVSGADACKSVEHLWRMPGTYNWPTEKKIAEGRSPDPFLTRWTITPETWNCVGHEDLRAAIVAKSTNAFDPQTRTVKPSPLFGEPLTPEQIRKNLASQDPNVEYSEYRDILASVHATPCTDEAFDKRALCIIWSRGEFHGGNVPQKWKDADADEKVGAIYDSVPPKEGGIGPGTLINKARAAGVRQQSSKETFADALANLSAEDAAPLEGGSEDHCISTSEDELAVQYVATRHRSVKFIPEAGEWAMLEGQRWHKKSKEEICEDMLPFARAQANKAPSVSSARKLVSRGHLSNSEALMRGKKRAIVKLEHWDSDPMLLNTPDGAYELPSGDRHVSEQPPYCLKATAVAPVPKGTDLRGACPLWLKFMSEITAGDVQYQKFLQRFIGYCLTGLTVEHAMVFAPGVGGNGKGVFFNSLNKVLGDYAQMAPLGMFEASLHERHTTEMARLHGARFVTAQETKKEARWDEVKIKAITGGDKITARWLFQKPFEFTPQCKLAIAGQHLPTLSRVDNAIKRRLLIVPFKVTFSNPDLDLPEKLWRERAGILRWAMDGTAEWKRIGLAPPPVVQQATRQYFAEQDHLGSWIGARCIVAPDGWAGISDLHADYCLFVQRAGAIVDGQRAFGQNLEARGFVRKPNRANTIRGFAGISLRPAGTMESDEGLPDLEQGEF